MSKVEQVLGEALKLAEKDRDCWIANTKNLQADYNKLEKERDELRAKIAYREKDIAMLLEQRDSIRHLADKRASELEEWQHAVAKLEVKLETLREAAQAYMNVAKPPMNTEAAALYYAAAHKLTLALSDTKTFTKP